MGAFGEQNEGHRAPLESLKNHWFYWCFCYVRVPGGSLEATLGLIGVPCGAPNGPCALFGAHWCHLGCSGEPLWRPWCRLRAPRRHQGRHRKPKRREI